MRPFRLMALAFCLGLFVAGCSITSDAPSGGQPDAKPTGNTSTEKPADQQNAAPKPAVKPGGG